MASPPVNVRRSKMRSLSNSEIFVVFTYYTLKQWDNSAQKLQAIIAAQRFNFGLQMTQLKDQIKMHLFNSSWVPWLQGSVLQMSRMK